MGGCGGSRRSDRNVTAGPGEGRLGGRRWKMEVEEREERWREGESK